MTEEKLKQEAEVFTTYYESLFPNEFETFYKAFLKIAEPREKRIAELEDENKHIYARMTRIDKVLDEKNREILELEAQIEKMKNQWNCKNNNGYCVSSICPCKDKWELKEK